MTREENTPAKDTAQQPQYTLKVCSHTHIHIGALVRCSQGREAKKPNSLPPAWPARSSPPNATGGCSVICHWWQRPFQSIQYFSRTSASGTLKSPDVTDYLERHSHGRSYFDRPFKKVDGRTKRILVLHIVKPYEVLQ